MSKKLLLSIFLLISIFYSCGGVIGNIERYRFTNVPMDSLKTAVSKVYIKHPDLKTLDTITFKDRIGVLESVDYYCIVQEKNDTFIFVYSYPDYPFPNDTIAEIALVTAAKYGDALKLATNIGYFKKKKYRELFENYFIKEVNIELKR